LKKCSELVPQHRKRDFIECTTEQMQSEHAGAWQTPSARVRYSISFAHNFKHCEECDYYCSLKSEEFPSSSSPRALDENIGEMITGIDNAPFSKTTAV